MAFNPRDYPPEWRTVIRPAVLARAHDRCEHCGVANHARGLRLADGGWVDGAHLDRLAAACGVAAVEVVGARRITIVLTIAHVPGYPTTDGDPAHLLALCQKCHLALDRPTNAVKARATRDRRRGQGVLA